MLANRGERFLGQPVAGFVELFLAGQDFAPNDAAFAARRLGDRGVEDFGRRPPDVGLGAVAFDERDDGMVGDDPVAVPVFDFGADGAAAAAFNLWWHGPQFTTKGPAFAGEPFSLPTARVYHPSASPALNTRSFWNLRLPSKLPP